MATLDRRADEQGFAWGFVLLPSEVAFGRHGHCPCVFWSRLESRLSVGESGQIIRCEWEWGLMCPDVLTIAGSSTLNPYPQY